MKRVPYIMLILSLTIPSVVLSVNLHTCTECHGKHFEKSAMGLSRIVKDLTKEELEKALRGYKADAHGGVMKGVMNQQLSKFTDEEIAQIVEDISEGNITDIVEEESKDEKPEVIEVDLSRCTSCHGETFEKPAMGLSRIVAEMSKEDIKASLHGYKDGSYGREKKALMVNQVINFSEEELDSIAEIIFNAYHYE